VIRCAGDDVLASVLGMIYWHLCWGWCIGICAGDDILASVLELKTWQIRFVWSKMIWSKWLLCISTL